MLLIRANLDGPGRQAGRQAASASRGIGQYPARHSIDHVKLPRCTWPGAAGTHSGSPTLAQPVYMKALHSMVHASPCPASPSSTPPNQRDTTTTTLRASATCSRCSRRPPAASSPSSSQSCGTYRKSERQLQRVRREEKQTQLSHHTTPNCKLCPLIQHDADPAGRYHHLTTA